MTNDFNQFDAMHFIYGADLSLLKRNKDLGVHYFSEEGDPVCPVEFFSQHGVQWARLRIFYDPSMEGAQINDLAYTLALASDLNAAGYLLLLDFHYSDTWADPQKQYPPSAWLDLSFDALVEAVYCYTYNVICEMKANGVFPSMVQIGNEITPGMLWDHGRLSPSYLSHSHSSSQSPLTYDSVMLSSWERLGVLLKAGIRGVEESIGRNIPILLHIDRGGDMETSQCFFDEIIRQGVRFDVIGLSYYPFWHGSLEDFENTLEFLGKRYGKGICLVEFAYPYKMQNLYENTGSDTGHGIRDSWLRTCREYPVSKEGQGRILNALLEILKSSSHGMGFFYWAPEWIPIEGFTDFSDEADAAACSARALFDENGRALPAFSILKKHSSEVRPLNYA